MPGLLILGRRWTVGSDDLAVPGLCFVIIHISLFIAISVYLGSSSEIDVWSSLDYNEIKNLNANHSTILRVKCATDARLYSFIFIGLLICAIVLEGVMVGFSIQGSIFNPSPRKPIEHILYARSVLGLIEVCFSIATSVYLARNWSLCGNLHHVFVAQAAIVAINFSLMIVVTMVIVCVYDPSGRTFYLFKKARRTLSNQSQWEEMRLRLDSHLQQSWKTSLRRCCCCARDSQNTQVALEEASYLLRDFFRDIDVVPSDILAGLILLRHKQQCAQSDKVMEESEVEEYLCGRPISNNTVFLNPTNPSERDRLEDLIYYCEYAIASYGALFYLAYNPGVGLCKLLNTCMCGHCGKSGLSRRMSNATVEMDSCFEWKTNAVRRALKERLATSDLIYASWDNDLYKQPFYVCVDHLMKAVVVTIRGTLSELDALTDIVATSASIPIEGHNGTWKCHKGMMNSAQFLKQKLTDDMILSRAFGHDLSRGTRDYHLVLVGHSLGAGIASILSIILKPQYPDIKCYAYSPPGGLLSLPAVEASMDYISTAVYGKDVFMRTSLPQLQSMKSDLVNLLKHTKNSKLRIIFGNMFQATYKRHSLFTDGPHVHDDAANLEQCLVNNVGNSGSHVEYEPLYPPGRILHVVYRRSYKTSCKNKKIASTSYFAVKANNKMDFNEILISHNMITHHWPQELLKAMKKVLDSPENDLPRNYTTSATIPKDIPASSSEADRTMLPQTTPPHKPCPIVKPPRHRLKVEGASRSDSIETVQAPLAQTHPISVTSSVPSVDSLQSTSDVKLLNLVQTVDTIAEINEEEQFHKNNSNNAPQPMSGQPVENGSMVSGKDDDAGTELIDGSIKEPSLEQVVANDQIHVENDDSVENAQKNKEPSTHKIRQSESLVDGLSNYIDVVLPGSCSVDNDVSAMTSSKYSRSQSLPPRYATDISNVDGETLKRAQFEPNLIPKPPRSRSSVHRRPSNLEVSRDYASAPPSRTTSPASNNQETSLE